MSKENGRMSDEYMKGYLDGIAIAKDVAESLLAQANSDKAVLMRWISELYTEMEAKERDISTLRGQIVEQNAKNTKLLELCEQMHRYMADTVEHNGYAIQTTGYTMLGSRVKECEDAMHELGVEVNKK